MAVNVKLTLSHPWQVAFAKVDVDESLVRGRLCCRGTAVGSQPTLHDSCNPTRFSILQAYKAQCDQHLSEHDSTKPVHM
jgi:hypothetical protein